MATLSDPATPPVNPSIAAAAVGFGTIFMGGAMVGGVFAASVFFPVLTPITALALGVIASSTGLIAGTAGALLARHPIAGKVVPIVLGLAVIGGGIGAMFALGVPFTAIGLAAAVGFAGLVAFGGVLALILIAMPFICCCAQSSGPSVSTAS